MNLRHYLLLSIVSIALVAVEPDLAILTLAMMVWLGGVFALRLRPSIQAIPTERRLPKAAEVLALAIGLVAAALTFTVLSLLMLPLTGLSGMTPPSVVAVVIGWIVMILCAAAPASPLWRQMLRPGTGDLGEAPLCPSAVGLFAGIPLGVGLLLVVQAMIEPFAEPYRSGSEVLTAAMIAPASVLATAFGALWIVQALRDRPEVSPVFQATIGSALIGCVGLVGVVGLNLAGGFGPHGLEIASERGGAVAAAYAVVIALAWTRALWVIGRFEVDSTISAVLIIVLLFFGFGFSLIIPGLILGTEWPDLVAVILFPFLVITAGVTAFVVPPVLRRLVWKRADLPWARLTARRGHAFR